MFALVSDPLRKESAQGSGMQEAAQAHLGQRPRGAQGAPTWALSGGISHTVGEISHYEGRELGMLDANNQLGSQRTKEVPEILV